MEATAVTTERVGKRVQMFEMYLDGATFEEIGQAHGVTRQRAHATLKRMGIPMRTPAEQSEARPVAINRDGIRDAADNPLRLWRKTNGVLTRTVAARVGVAANTVTLWESGSIKPSKTNMLRLISLTRIFDLAQKWEDWHTGKSATEATAE